jgi:tetratricopeptide (TPR) repeat protein
VYRDGKYEEAIAEFDEAILLLNDFPNHFAFYFDRGRARVKMKDYRGAIADFDTTIRNVKTKATLEDSYQWRGDAKFIIKDYRGALADYNQYLLLVDCNIEYASTI